jgi:hypothetical protein
VRFGAPARDRPRVVRSFERCAGTAGRAGSAGPVGRAPTRRRASRARRLDAWTVDRTPLLRFRVPCSARLPRRSYVPGGATSPAIPLRPLTCVVVLLRPWHRVRAVGASCDAPTRAARHRAPTHRRRWLSLRFYAWRNWPGRLCADRRRAFWPGRFAVLVASLHRTRPSPPRVMRRRILGQPAFRYPRVGLRGLVGPLFGGRSLLGFPSRELGRQRGRPVVTRVTVSLSTPFARRRSWGFQMSLRRFDPADGRASRFHALGPTCRSSINRSRCFSRAVGRPG